MARPKKDTVGSEDQIRKIIWNLTPTLDAQVRAFAKFKNMSVGALIAETFQALVEKMQKLLGVSLTLNSNTKMLSLKSAQIQ